MIVLAVIPAAIIFLAMLRFGVSAEYSVDGISLKARAGPFSIRIFPRREKAEKPEKAAQKKAVKKARKAKRAKKKPEAERPGALKTFLDMIPPIKNALGRLRRRLLIKNLTIHIITAGADPSKTALMFGAANAAFGMIVPVLENAFRIKRRDLRVSADFGSAQPRIYIKAAISLAVWESFYAAAALLPLISVLSGKSAPTAGNTKKPEQENEQTQECRKGWRKNG